MSCDGCRDAPLSAVNSAVRINSRSNTSVSACHGVGQQSGGLGEWLLWEHRSEELKVRSEKKSLWKGKREIPFCMSGLV